MGVLISISEKRKKERKSLCFLTLVIPVFNPMKMLLQLQPFEKIYG